MGVGGGGGVGVYVVCGSTEIEPLSGFCPHCARLNGREGEKFGILVAVRFKWAERDDGVLAEGGGGGGIFQI